MESGRPDVATRLRALGPSGPLPRSGRALGSGLLACVCFGVLGLVSTAALGPGGPLWVVPSLGATAVILFATPESPFARPWNVVVGHVVSGLVGVTLARTLGAHAPVLTIALAAGLSISAMMLLRAVHPPGGATALIAVLGGPAVARLGYGYVLHPVLVCAVAMLAFAALVRRLGRAPRPVSDSASTAA